jgi:hypothetical protein
MSEIKIHGETFHVDLYRRNYKRCRACRTRTGTAILSAEPVEMNFQRNPLDDRPSMEGVYLAVICETCGRRWVPTRGLTLRAMKVQQ